MRRINRLSLAVLSAAALALSISPAAAPALASAGPAACPAPIVPGDTVLCGTFRDGASYLIEAPHGWSHGTLFLYSHGYVEPGMPNPATDVGDPITGGWLLTHGYAIAGSSYATTGWAIQQALPDQIHTLSVFGKTFGHPAQTIAWGHSLGGIITAGLIQDFPGRFTAALPMCGVLSGGVATWNTALDSEVAFKTLVDPAVKLVNLGNGGLGNLLGALSTAAAAQKTAKGRARLALSAALADIPGWFTSLSTEPASTNYAAQERNQYLWASQVDFPFAFYLRAELEKRAGGNVSWNTGVNYFRDFARSADASEVRHLFRAAGLSLHAALAKINASKRVKAKPSALRYLRRYIVFNGDLSMPVLTLHTSGDGLVVPENEQAYAAVVHRAGKSALLRQIFVHRAGHCAFTPAETITAAQTLLSRLSTGKWNASALLPKNLNAAARALGPAYNVFSAQGKKGNKCPAGKPVHGLCATAPAFLRYKPFPYLRPYPK